MKLSEINSRDGVLEMWAREETHVIFWTSSAESNLFFQTFIDFRLSQWFIVDVGPALAYLHHAEVGCVSDTASYTLLARSSTHLNSKEDATTVHDPQTPCYSHKQFQQIPKGICSNTQYLQTYHPSVMHHSPLSFPFPIKIYHWATRNTSTTSHVTWPTVEKLRNVVCGEHLNEGPLGCIIWRWLLMNLIALIGPFFGHNCLFIIPYCLDWAIAPFPFWVCWTANLCNMHTHLPYYFTQIMEAECSSEMLAT
jgi:hypothetical protein